jgi:hypothetical protein
MLTRIAARRFRPLPAVVEDALGVALLFGLLVAGLSFPAFA